MSAPGVVRPDIVSIDTLEPKRGFSLRRFAGVAAHREQTDGLRIAHVTDLHVGLVTPMAAQLEAARLVNAGNPDAVVITGDFVCHSQKHLDALGEVIAAYEAPVFAVMGNHDYWSGAAEVRRTLLRAGAEVLDNAHTTITLRHERLQVVGLDDAYTGHADWEKATKGLRPNIATLGLSHIAEEAGALWSRGVPMVLSGHTHAGQVTLAKLHEIAIGKIAGHRYVHGLYGSRSQNEAVYVGAGVGAAVVPLRLGERGKREVTFFELGATPEMVDEEHGEQEAHPGRKPSAKTQAKRRAAVEKKAARRQARESRRKG